MAVRIKRLKIAKKKESQPPRKGAIIKKLRSGILAKEKQKRGEAVPVTIEGGVQIPVELAGKVPVPEKEEKPEPLEEAEGGLA